MTKLEAILEPYLIKAFYPRTFDYLNHRGIKRPTEAMVEQLWAMYKGWA